MKHYSWSFHSPRFLHLSKHPGAAKFRSTIQLRTIRLSCEICSLLCLHMMNIDCKNTFLLAFSDSWFSLIVVPGGRTVLKWNLMVAKHRLSLPQSLKLSLRKNKVLLEYAQNTCFLSKLNETKRYKPLRRFRLNLMINFFASVMCRHKPHSLKISNLMKIWKKFLFFQNLKLNFISFYLNVV